MDHLKRVLKVLAVNPKRQQLLDRYKAVSDELENLEKERKELGYRNRPGLGGGKPLTTAELFYASVARDLRLKLDRIQNKLNEESLEGTDPTEGSW